MHSFPPGAGLDSCTEGDAGRHARVTVCSLHSPKIPSCYFTPEKSLKGEKQKLEQKISNNSVRSDTGYRLNAM